MKITPALLSAAIAFAMATPVLSQTFKTDPGHTEVRFGWSHAGVSRQHGEFTKLEGILDLDAENIEASKLNVTIDASSVSTGVVPLDDHLKNADFLEVEKYPNITFVSTSIAQTSDTTADIMGDLTIQDVTLPVTLKTTLTHKGEHPLGANIDYYKGDWIAFSAQTEIDHMAFGVGPFSTGPIAIEIDTEMKASN